jgi:hypothetical protein
MPGTAHFCEHMLFLVRRAFCTYDERELTIIRARSNTHERTSTPK